MNSLRWLRDQISTPTVVRTMALAYGAGLLLHMAHLGQPEREHIEPILHWLRDSTLSVPLAVVAVLLGRAVQRAVLALVAGDSPTGGHRALAAIVGLLATAWAYAATALPGSLVHGWLFVEAESSVDAGHGQAISSTLGHLLGDGAVALAAATLVLLGDLVLLQPVLARRDRSPNASGPAASLATVPAARTTRRVGPIHRRATPAVASSLLLSTVLVPVVSFAPAQGVEPPTTPCAAASADRRYDVSAISVTVPYNRFGDVDPNGMVYVFDQDRAAVENWYRPLAADPATDPAGNRRLRPRPLVIRANEGECVEVRFTNRLAGRALDGGAVIEPRASMNVSGAAVSAQLDGSHVGFNGDSTVGRDQSITYFWRAPAQEGLHLFRDMAMSAGGEADGGSMAHGLWGAFVVEPAGSQWFDSHSGLPLYPVSSVREMSGELYIDADIKLPAGRFFRESVQISQDEIPGVGMGFNYGADSGEDRETKRCPDCVGEETSLSSWTYGEPAAVKLASGLAGLQGWPVGPGIEPEDCQSDDGTSAPRMLMPPGIPGGCWTSNVTHAYPGDPTKLRIGHAGVKETHVFHMHAHQWLSEAHDVGAAGTNPTRPSDQSRPEATTIDSQTYGPGEAFTADLLFGAGSAPRTIGDSIFHCHLYPHFADGFWSLFRVHDVREDGTLETPDGVRTRLLTVLPDRTTAGDVPSGYDAETNPGFPRFVPGRVGWRAPQPPGGITGADGSPAVRMVAGQGLDEALLNQVQDVDTSFPPSDEVQRVGNDAAGGEFTLSFRDQTTTPLPFDAPAGVVQGALEALANVGAGNVSVASTVAQQWEVTFTGPLGGQDQPTLVATDAFLTAPTVDANGQPVPPAPDTTARTTVTVSVEGGTSVGSFTLRYRGEETSALRATSTPAEIEAALEALPSIGDVTVSPRGDAGTAWRVSFADPALNVRALVAQSPAVTVTTVQNEWHRALAAERAAQDRAFANTGKSPKPGAPFTDPCPQGARQVDYEVSVLQRDLVYNDDGWHDTQGRILVLSKDVEAVLAGTKKPEPLFFRVNAGDCVNFSLTNLLPNWYGGDAFQVLQQTNMFGQHIHLVKFDVLASDGSSNGWNYQQAAFTAQQARFNDNIIDGTQSCTANEATGACRLPLPGSFDPAGAGAPPGQTIHERWYADYELRTAFTHDHHFPAVDQGRGLYGGLIVEPSGMDFRNPRTGEYHQPVNDPAHGSVCGTSCTGTAAGAMFDVIGPGAKDDFREFGLSIQDFVPLIRAGGDPTNPADAFNPPEVPETFADDDPGVMGINYRNEPFLIRDTVNGVRTDPAYVFSSTVHGDPATPLLEAYGGDPVRMRVIQGSQEEQHVMAVHGMRWRQEPDDPDSPYVAATSIGVSEAFNFEIPEMECVDNSDCRGDYLYSGTSTDDLYLGAWGLMRVYGKGKQGLLPLPDNQPQAANGTINLNATGETPPPANKPGKPCPTGAPVRSFTVAATDARIEYNRQGDHDPYGLVYVAAEAGETVAEAVARAKADPQPMALRANEGDCIELRLHNRIDPKGPFATHAPLGTADGDPALPLEPPTGTPAGLRVSLHPQLLRYDVRGSDGATVGFNRDQTVAPGEEILYRWFADDVTPGELGALNLTDYGDVRGHRHHGLFAGLTIEPTGATYHDPFTGEEIVSGMAADVRIPGMPDFRDFTSFFQDGLNLRDAAGAQIPDGFAHPPVPGEPPETVDAEDRGEKAFGYRSSPYRHRLGFTPMAADATSPMSGTALASVLSSTVHGDPDTPMLRAYAGDPVRVRLLQGADKPRQHTFTVHGHSWRAQPRDPGSTVIGAQGGLSVGRAANVELPGAGNGTAGDYLYADQVGFHHLSGGTWGILRAYPSPDPAPLFTPSPLATGGQSDSPYRAGYHPLMPLELANVRVHVYDDTDMDGTRDTDEAVGPAQKVRLVSTDGSGTSLERPLDAKGNASFWVGRGAYDVVVSAPADWQLTGPGTVRVDLTADGAAEKVSIGMVRLGDAAVRLYNDKDGSGTRDTGEGPLAGWPVTLERGTDKRTATTDADGRAVFTDLVPTEWKLTSPGQPGWHATRRLPVAVAVAENQDAVTAPETRLGFTLPAGLSVKVFNDANGDGAQQPGESSKAGWKVTVVGGPDGHEVSVPATTDANGVATFDDPTPGVDGLVPGPYRLTVATSGDWRLGTGSSVTTAGGTTAATAGFGCDAQGCSTGLVEETAQVVTMPVTNPNSWLSATPFNDLNNDGVKQDRERTLSGWWVTALGGPDGIEAGAQTGNDGRAGFYPVKPGRYTLQMISPEPSSDPNVLDWTATNRAGCVVYGDGQKLCRVEVDVIPGETGSARFGFVQLGTVGVEAFHDYDRNGTQSDWEPDQANRTVTLYDANGRTALQQKVTDGQGRAAFKVSAGVKYQVQVALPTGWVQTSPLDARGRPIAKVAVVGPIGTESTRLTFGQYNTVDSTAPPAPTSSVRSGEYQDTQNVALTSESGATIRYTLSGAMPTATTGLVYNGPVTVSATHLLRAIAVDTAGNVSPELTDAATGTGVMITVHRPATTARAATAVGWTVLTGGAAAPPAGSTLPAALAADDAIRVTLPSAYVTKGKKYLVDGYATVPLGPLASPASLTVEVDGRASLAGSDRSLALWDFPAQQWVTLTEAETQSLDDTRTVVDAAGPLARFLENGEVRIRLTSERKAGAFDARLDHVLVRVIS